MTAKSTGRLTFVKRFGRKALYKCECGTEKLMFVANVNSGKSTSCGCFQRENAKIVGTKHGGVGTPLYQAWYAMKRRCYNPNHQSYPWYGGKGITVCPRWLNDFAAFAADMGQSFRPGLTLDRHNSGLDYTPENCQWLTQSENSKKSNRTS